MPTYIENFKKIYSETSLDLGAADILVSDPEDVVDRAAAFAFLMSLARREEGAAAVTGVFIIAPPEEVSSATDVAIRASITRVAGAHLKRFLTAEEQSSIDGRIKTIRTVDLRASSLFAAMQEVSAGSAAIVVEASLYRDDRTELVTVTGVEPGFLERTWVSHVASVAKSVVEIAKHVSFYVLIDTAATVSSEQGKAPLMSIADCGVFTWERQNDPAKLVAAHSAEWDKQVRNGEIGSAFRSVDELPAWLDSQKPFIKLQLLDRVAPSHELLKVLRNLIQTQTLEDPQALLRLARIARRAGDDDLARSMLGNAIPALTTQEELQVALETARELDGATLTDVARTRLHKLFPNSKALIKDDLDAAIEARDYGAIQPLLEKGATFLEKPVAFVYRTLAIALSTSERPEYSKVLTAVEQAAPDQAAWARIVCVRDAVARRDFLTAVKLCTEVVGRPRQVTEIRMLLWSLRQLMLQRSSDGDWAITGEALQEPLSAVIDYLSAHPEDGTTRLSLSTLLSVETSGSLGLASIIATTLRSAGAIVPSAHPATEQTNEGSQSEPDILPFLESAMEWMASESPIILEVAKLPSKLITGPPDIVFANVKQVIRSDQDLRDPATADTFEKLVYIGVLLAPHTSDPTEDLDLIRYAGARMIAANRVQKARDLAEQALAIGGGTPERRRLAWLAFADVYHRANNVLDSLLAMACVYATQVSIGYEQVWQETYLLARILRDIHFTDQAKSLLEVLRSVVPHLQQSARYQQRLTSLELGIRLAEVTRKGDYSGDQLQQLTDDVEAHCSGLLNHNEEVAPAASMLAHCAYLSRLANVTTNPSVKTTLERALVSSPASLRALIETVTSERTGAEQLIALAKSVETARYPEDIAYDLGNVVTAARRFLDTDLALRDPEAAILAIELLADHALRGSLIGTEASPTTAVGTTARRASEISSAGIRVVFLGRCESGRLVRVNVEDTHVQGVVFEKEEVFSIQKFVEWSAKFPYGYSLVKDPMNLFYMSTDRLGITISESEATVIVADSSLQQLPPNLIRIGEEFAGQTTPMAAVPSLSWLWLVRNSATPPGRRRKAWISTETSEGKSAALVMVAERLEESLREYAIELDTEPRLPDGLDNSEIAVIAAHGGILPEGRFIQRLSNDAELSMYPATLASALRGTTLVVLFVCSGGRIDSHPIGDTTVGLVKELLSWGCSTVIASPWPLSVSVPPHWLPTFLHEWMSGKTAVEANYLANKKVATKLGDSPLDSLAMNVFGDPLRTKA